MRASSVIVRFLSLLDVALLLLGILMVVLAHSQLRSDEAKQGSASLDRADLAVPVDFIFVYAGWRGEQNGKCYLLGRNGKPGKELRTDSAADIRNISTGPHGKERRKKVVILVFPDDGWFSAWDEKKISAIKEAWGLDLFPLYKVPLPR